jgi:hypothetical protein
MSCSIVGVKYNGSVEGNDGGAGSKNLLCPSDGQISLQGLLIPRCASSEVSGDHVF